MIAVVGPRYGDLGCAGESRRLPLAVLLGGTHGPVPAYNSNGLWLTDVETLAREAEELVAEGGFTGLKLRLGRDRLADDLAAIREVRTAAGDGIKLMVDFNQGLPLGDALDRCHALDDQGLYWFEEPIAYDNTAGYAQLARELARQSSSGRTFTDLAISTRRCGLARRCVMPDLMRIGGVAGWLRAAPIAAAAGIQVSTHLHPRSQRISCA